MVSLTLQAGGQRLVEKVLRAVAAADAQGVGRGGTAYAGGINIHWQIAVLPEVNARPSGDAGTRYLIISMRDEIGPDEQGDTAPGNAPLFRPLQG